MEWPMHGIQRYSHHLIMFILVSLIARQKSGIVSLIQPALILARGMPR